ncbi:UvrD-helicase domain-containing protein [Halothiobacillus sp. DCM-1]|uniref:UvrD-helicase domain-containing protein n=1 Tax=Halothiobacillus sp. DCM-1 TaxID=3112558 RepID=UPI0032502D4C
MNADLNAPQRAAVRHTQGPLLVLAGAGSGKTRVITEKIVHLIERSGVAARNIYAVTFTNKAAREMNTRIANRLPAERRRGLNISTFHTLGLNLIRKEYAALGLRPGFTVMDADDSLTLIKNLLLQSEFKDVLEPKALQWQISLWKNELLRPEALATHADEEIRAQAALFAQYQQQLAACNALDFDDLIGRPVALLQNDAAVRERWQARVRYLLVDEYQDTNTTQYELVRLLVGKLGAFTAVGDDHQSIYAWRGARPENLQRLASDFPNLSQIKLEQNYRSVNSILDAANHLIAKDTTTHAKRLWSAVGPGEPHRVIVCAHAEEEAERIATEILHHHFRHQTDYRHFAVLFRGNHQARLVEQALRKLNIPYTLTGGQSFFDRAEIKDAMAYLKLLVNPQDDAAFLRVINTPRREIGSATLEKLGQQAQEWRSSLFAAATSVGIASRLDARAHERLTRFTDWLNDIRQRPGDALATVRQLFTEIDYAGYLRTQETSLKAAERRWQNVEEWLEWLEKISREHEDGSMDLPALAQRMTLLGILDQQTREQDSNAVALLTLHAAKGLEFNHVYLAGMEEDTLPHRDCQDEERLAEERRLCFVGITRARLSLTFTLCKRRRRYGEWRDITPSRFLDDIPESLLHWQGVGITQTQAASETQAKAHLAGILAMLKS